MVATPDRIKGGCQYDGETSWPVTAPRLTQTATKLFKTKGSGAVPSSFNSCGKLENVSLCSFQGGGEKEIGRLYLKEKWAMAVQIIRLCIRAFHISYRAAASIRVLTWKSIGFHVTTRAAVGLNLGPLIGKLNCFLLLWLVESSTQRFAIIEISLSRVARRWWSQTFLVVTTQRCKNIYSGCSLCTFTTMSSDGGGLLTAD